MSDNTILGVDIGGTHITAALVDLETQAILPNSRFRAYVNAQGTVEEILETWGAVMKDARGGRSAADTKLGISIPGPFDYEKGICQFQNQNKYDCLYGLNVKELLATQVDAKPENIRLVNDAGCFLRGEAFAGAAKNVTTAIGLTLGTGLGSATLMNGVAEDAALWCAPFKDSIAEEYLSTRAFLRAYEGLTGKQVADVKELSALYPHDAAAREVFQVFAENLALFLAPYLQEIEPEIVIIGGNIANAWDLFIPDTIHTLATMGLAVPIHKVALAEEAALLGAASYWQSEMSEVKPKA